MSAIRPAVSHGEPEGTDGPRLDVGFVRPLLDAEGCARLLRVSPATVERLRLKAGLPAIDLGFRRPGRRPKRLWRYDPVEVREWWRRRASAQRGVIPTPPAEVVRGKRLDGTKSSSFSLSVDGL